MLLSTTWAKYQHQHRLKNFKRKYAKSGVNVFTNQITNNHKHDLRLFDQWHFATKRSVMLSSIGHQHSNLNRTSATKQRSVLERATASIHYNQPDVNSSLKRRAAFRAQAHQVIRNKSYRWILIAHFNCREIRPSHCHSKPSPIPYYPLLFIMRPLILSCV